MSRLLNISGMWKDNIVEQDVEVDYRYLIGANIAFKDLPLKFNVHNGWKEIWESWCRFNHRIVLNTPNEVVNPNMWYNSNIRIKKEVAFFKPWVDKGIMYIYHLLNIEENRFFTFDEFCRRYSIKTPFTLFYGIKKAIPGEWVSLLEQQWTEEDGVESVMDGLEEAEKVFL